MIVKVPEQRQFPSASKQDQKKFDDLVDYLLENFEQEKTRDFLLARYGFETNHEVVQAGFADILTYASADRSLTGSHKTDSATVATVQTGNETAPNPLGDKCLAVELHGVAHLSTAIAEMNAVSARNPRVKDAAYHFILSWPEHESPAHDKIFDAARHALKALNLHEHQYMVAIHGNTDNIHCHVAVNRVHPRTFKSQHLAYAQRTLHRAARESEIKHGWTHDNGIYIVEVGEDGQKRIVKNLDIDTHATDAYTEGARSKDRSATANSRADSATNVSPWTDPESLLNWMRKTIAPSLKKAMPNLSHWLDLHQFLSHYGVTLNDTGGGGLRLSAIDAQTGEVLDIAASKALRQLKRQDLESRWGAYQKHTPANQTKPQRSVNHAPESLTDFDRFDQYGEHPSITARKQRLSELRGLDVDDDGNGASMLLPGDARLHMEHNEADFDTDLRSGSDGGRTQITRSAATSRANRPTPSTAAKLDTFQYGAKKRKRDPEMREQRKAERAAERIALRQRYQTYRSELREMHLAHQAKMAVLRDDQQQVRQMQKEAFYTDKRAILSAQENGSSSAEHFKLDGVYSDTSTKLALLAANHAIAKLQLTAQQRAERAMHNITRPPTLSWRDWLLESAQQGDQAALAALRGIVYQAKRDENNMARSQEVHTNGASALVTDSPSADETDYIAIVAKMRKEEMQEQAIRSADRNQVRPHECDPLLVITQNMTYRVTGNGNVRFFDQDQHLFTDRGNRLTFDRAIVTDDELRLALLHAREKFGNRITLTGEDAIFTERMVKMADDLGITVINPELQAIVRAHRASKATQTPATQTPATQTPATQTPATQTPATQTPATQTPATQTPATQTPATQTPATQTPATQTPATQTPATQTPATQTPATQTPATQTPATQTAPLLVAQELVLPLETECEELRQEILAANPMATFVTVNPTLANQYVGKIVAVRSQAFVQQVGRQSFAVHQSKPPAKLPPNKVIALAYKDGYLEVRSNARTGKSKGR